MRLGGICHFNAVARNEHRRCGLKVWNTHSGVRVVIAVTASAAENECRLKIEMHRYQLRYLDEKEVDEMKGHTPHCSAARYSNHPASGGLLHLRQTKRSYYQSILKSKSWSSSIASPAAGKNSEPKLKPKLWHTDKPLTCYSKFNPEYILHQPEIVICEGVPRLHVITARRQQRSCRQTKTIISSYVIPVSSYILSA
jgi:hypothetical protein